MVIHVLLHLTQYRYTFFAIIVKELVLTAAHPPFCVNLFLRKLRGLIRSFSQDATPRLAALISPTPKSA